MKQDSSNPEFSYPTRSTPHLIPTIHPIHPSQRAGIKLDNGFQSARNQPSVTGNIDNNLASAIQLAGHKQNLSTANLNH